MNKKILSLLCLLSAFQSARADVAVARNNAVTLSVAVGQVWTSTSAIENNTDAALQDIFYNPTKKDGGNPALNTYAAFNADFTPVFLASEYNSSSGVYSNFQIPGYYIKNTQPNDAQSKFLPTPINVAAAAPIAASPINYDAWSLTLGQQSAYQENQMILAAIEYNNISSINGSTGLDVNGNIGFQWFIKDGLYAHVKAGVGFLNTKSQNDASSSYVENKVYVDAVNVQQSIYSTTKNGNAAGGTATAVLYAIEPRTDSSEGALSKIPNALTYKMNMYWNFVAKLGYQLNEGVSVEAGVGYQMTRTTANVLSVTNSVDGASAVFTAPSTTPQSTIGDSTSVALNGASSYDLKGNVEPFEEDCVRWLSGVRMEFGMNFTIAKNLTLGINMYHVFNAKRTYTIEDIQVSPSSKLGASSQQQSQQSNTTNNASTTQTNTQATDAGALTQTFEAEMAQDLSGMDLMFTYKIPVGQSECAPAA